MNLRGQDGEPLSLNKVLRYNNFPDGATNPKVYKPEEIEGKRVILVDTHTSRVNMNERAWTRVAFLKSILDGAGATEVNLATFPIPYSRQDADPNAPPPKGNPNDPAHKKRLRKHFNIQGEPFALDDYIGFLSYLGIKRIITAENHNPAGTEEIIQRRFGKAKGVFFNLDPFILFGHLFKNFPMYGADGQRLDFGQNGSNVVLGGFDVGALDRLERFAHYAGWTEYQRTTQLKNRLEAANPEAIEILKQEKGYDTLEGRIFIIPDDIFDSGGTMDRALMAIPFSKEGKPAYLIAVVPYPINTGEAFDRLERNNLNMWTMTFRPNIAMHDEYGAETINPLFIGKWLADEFGSIMTTGKPILIRENLGNLTDSYLSTLYELRDPSPMEHFRPNGR